MMIVPKGKTVFVGSRRFVEGEVLPPFVSLEDPLQTIVTKTKTTQKKKTKKKSRKGKRNRNRGLY